MKFQTKMNKLISIILLAFFLIQHQSFTENKPQLFYGKVEELVSKYYPKSKVKPKKNEDSRIVYQAKHETMIFDIHSIGKDGRVSEESRKEEGPNYKGFIITIEEHTGQYRGAAGLNQELKEPYYNTFLNAIKKKDGSGFYWIRFSYGSRIDAKFKKELMSLLK